MLILVSQSPVLVIDALVCCEGYKLFAMSFVRDLKLLGLPSGFRHPCKRSELPTKSIPV